MTRIVPKLCSVAAALALTLGLAGGAWAQQPSGTAAPAGGPGGGGGSEGYAQQGSPDAAGPTGAARALAMPILYVTSVEVVRTAADPKLDIIRVTGLASSAGWSNPQLVPFFYGKPADDVLDLQLIADSPEQSQKADGFVPLGAMFTLESGHPFKGVRVRAGANAIELKAMPGSAENKVTADSGKDLIGKKFLEKGPAGPGVVTAADLPRGFRTIAPSHGVAGITHNPNRLNLILDDQNKIVMAFWE
ncbi:MAG TPA: hypothetical protein VHW66_03120 [Stellaceae bacterium]|jgi:hypothetical protein|nr:hypothetical protein [Stellaceae bacterium]